MIKNLWKQFNERRTIHLEDVKGTEWSEKPGIEVVDGWSKHFTAGAHCPFTIYRGFFNGVIWILLVSGRNYTKMKWKNRIAALLKTYPYNLHFVDEEEYYELFYKIVGEFKNSLAEVQQPF
jgi:hypothetical protein